MPRNHFTEKKNDNDDDNTTPMHEHTHIHKILPTHEPLAKNTWDFQLTPRSPRWRRECWSSCGPKELSYRKPPSTLRKRSRPSLEHHNPATNPRSHPTQPNPTHTHDGHPSHLSASAAEAPGENMSCSGCMPRTSVIAEALSTGAAKVQCLGIPRGLGTFFFLHQTTARQDRRQRRRQHNTNTRTHTHDPPTHPRSPFQERPEFSASAAKPLTEEGVLE